jgi:xylan 1,4-beta-xylosidase
MIQNPILPGFNPDPSIVRVGADYYIATSTFEWYPGVQIHHSRDLANWRFVTRPLTRASQLDMRGNPDSCGVWAPCLSHADGLFWLVYSDVKRFDGNFKDVRNYIVTAASIEGPWSDPVYVNGSGFDPSLFHDVDGRKWFLQMQWNHRPAARNTIGTHPAFDGILCQEWDAESGRLVGPVHNIFAGTQLGLVEGPHLFRRGDYYYLTTAEGGTGYDHAVTMARSKSLTGPYELHPDKYLITSKDAPDAALQRAGHGQYVETPEGEAYHTHLCGRPLAPLRRCTLGRETALQKCVWGEDGWLRLAQGGAVPDIRVPAPGDAETRPWPDAIEYRFESAGLPEDFQWLRTPEPGRLFSLVERPGHLRLFGRESIGSWYEFSLVARRQQHHRFRAETTVAFDPSTYQQMAGLTHYYNRYKFHAIGLTHDEEAGIVVSILSCNGNYPQGRLDFPIGTGIAVEGSGISFAAEVRDNDLQFFARMRPEAEWVAIGPVLDGGVISDEGGVGEHGSFTGAFVGMFAFDITGGGKAADFDGFRYQAIA